MGSVSKTVSKITMKVICLLLVLVAAATAFETCGKKGSGSRIINGVDAGHGEFPWQISLRFGRYGHICGGTLIGKQHVLCAAHCFGQTKNPNSYTVRVGEWHLKRRDGSEEDHAVSEVHVHERYNYPKQFNNDIAIMKLKNPVDLSGPYAGLACMPAAGKDYRGHSECQLSGWGTPAAPSSAPMAAVPTMSSVLSLSVPAPAPANPVSSPRSPPTGTGSLRSLVEWSKKFFSVFFFNSVLLSFVVK